MFKKIVNFVKDVVWPIGKPLIFTFFPQYEPLLNTILPIAEPWVQKLIEQAQSTVPINSTIEVNPSQILSNIEALGSYKTLTQLSGQSSQLLLLTDDTDVFAPVEKSLNFSIPPIGSILPEWTMNYPGGILALDGDDILVGSNQTDVINGNTGNDQLSGGEGIDLLRGGRGNDTLQGDGGNDVINGNRDDDLIIGGDGDDLLRGGKGRDSLEGSAGNDILIGDLEADLLTGGLGSDRFILGANPAELQLDAAQADIITDFNSSESDKIIIIASLTEEQLTLETFDPTANLALTNGATQGIVIRQTNTGNIFGIVTNTTDINAVRNGITIVNISDPLLGLG